MVHDLTSFHVRRRPIALALLTALALSACGAGAGAGTGSTASSPSPQRSASSTASATSTATTTTALPGTGRPKVTIGDKNDTEQFVLGALYQQALKAQGFQVSLNQNLGPPAVTREALKNGSLAMYPEYLNVFDQTVAGYRRGFHSARTAYAAAQAWARRNGLRLLKPTPFSDTYGIAVTVAYAAVHRLRTVADLSHVDRAFVIGGAVQFQDARPGLPTLADIYRVTPRTFKAIAVGSQYDDLATGEVQAAFVNTTDGELASGDYRLLSDPRRIFGFGNVVPVVTTAALIKEGPAFTATIDRVDRTLTLSAVRALNNAADAKDASPSAIALTYLQTHGLLTSLTPSQIAAGG